MQQKLTKTVNITDSQFYFQFHSIMTDMEKVSEFKKSKGKRKNLTHL